MIKVNGAKSSSPIHWSNSFSLWSVAYPAFRCCRGEEPHTFSWLMLAARDAFLSSISRTSDPYLIRSLSSRLLSALWSGFDLLMHKDPPSLYPPFSCLAAAWPPRQRSALILPVPLHWFKIYVVCNRVCFLQEVLFVLWETFCLFCMDGWIFLPVRLLAAVEPYRIVLGSGKRINVGGHCMCVSDWSWMCEFTIFSVSRWKLNC